MECGELLCVVVCCCVMMGVVMCCGVLWGAGVSCNVEDGLRGVDDAAGGV